MSIKFLDFTKTIVNNDTKMFQRVNYERTYYN